MIVIRHFTKKQRNINNYTKEACHEIHIIIILIIKIEKSRRALIKYISIKLNPLKKILINQYIINKALISVRSLGRSCFNDTVNKNISYNPLTGNRLIIIIKSELRLYPYQIQNIATY